MLNLNLLPPAEKEHLIYVCRARSLVVIASGFIAVLGVSFVLLLPTFSLLFFQKTEAIRAVAIEREAEERTGLKDRIARIERVNRLAHAVEEHESKRGDLAGLFESILRDVPPGVRIASLRIKSQTRELSLVGFAPTRQHLLELLKNLERNARVATVSSPITNIIREVDIDFSIAITLTP